MAGCLDSVNINLDLDLGEKRNTIASITSGIFFTVGWWIYIDAALVYSKDGQWSNSYIIVSIFATIAMFMVNAVSNSQEAMEEGILGTKGSRFWLLIAFILSFASIIASVWIMFADYVLVGGQHPVYPGAYIPLMTLSNVILILGVALFLNVFLIFLGSFVYKFGRAEEYWG